MLPVNHTVGHEPSKYGQTSNDSNDSAVNLGRFSGDEHGYCNNQDANHQWKQVSGDMGNDHIGKLRKLFACVRFLHKRSFYVPFGDFAVALLMLLALFLGIFIGAFAVVHALQKLGVL